MVKQTKHSRKKHASHSPARTSAVHKKSVAQKKTARNVARSVRHAQHTAKAKPSRQAAKAGTKAKAKPTPAQKARDIDKRIAAKNAVEEYKAAANAVISSIEADAVVSSYLKKNVSRRALEVARLLETPKTDEDIAAQLDMKINAIRRILNIMQGYGITNYNISKNVDGWLSFAWYINVNKIGQFLNYVKNMSQVSDVIKDDCNDYFICKDCYSDNKLIFTFDAAYEASFRCTCNGMLTRIDRIEADKLAKEANAQSTIEKPVPESADYDRVFLPKGPETVQAAGTKHKLY